jgi:3-dehydroquinate synthetase
VAAELSQTLAGLPKGEAARLTRVALRLGGPWPPPVPEAEARRLLQAEKKSRRGKLRVVLLAAVERPVLMEVSADDILNAAAEIYAKGRPV